jgi:hypothetical protein
MQVTRGYEKDIESGFRAYYETEKVWPTGDAKRKLIHEATDRAEARLEKLTRLVKDNSDPGTPAPSAKSPAVSNNAATARPSASTQSAAQAAIAAELARRK